MGLIRAPKDFWTGVIYLSLGLFGIVVGQGYSFGSAGRMGPGYFPVVVSALLVLFGLITVGRSFVVAGEPVGHLAWKATALIVGSVAVFGFLLPGAGLVVAMTVMVLMSAAGSEKFRFDAKATAGLVGLVLFCSLVFVKGLGVPMPLVGSWFGQ